MGTQSGAVKLRSLTSTTMYRLRAYTYLAPGGDRRTITALAFVRNGRSLVAGFENGVAWLWNLEAPSALLTLLAPSASGGTGARQISRIGIAATADGSRWRVERRDRPVEGLGTPSAMDRDEPGVEDQCGCDQTDSRSLFTGSADGFVDRWQLDDGRVP